MIPALPEGFKLDTNIPTPPPGFTVDEGMSISSNVPEPPSGFKLDAIPEIKISPAGTGILPSMPKDKPAITPNPLEQVKVHGMVSSLPAPLSEEVKKAAIEKQREKQFGVYKNPSLIPNPITMVENVPENFEDIVKTTGSLLMNAGRMAYNSVFDRDALNEQLKPAVELTGAVIKDWQAMFKGKTPTEIEKTPVGKAVTRGFETLERQGITRTLSKFVEEKPLDALLWTQALKTVAGGGVRVTAETAQKVIPKGTVIADKLDKFLSTDRTPIVFELPAETQVPKTAEEIAAKTPVSVAEKVTAPLKSEKGEVAFKLPPEETAILTKAREGATITPEEIERLKYGWVKRQPEFEGYDFGRFQRQDSEIGGAHSTRVLDIFEGEGRITAEQRPIFEKHFQNWLKTKSSHDARAVSEGNLAEFPTKPGLKTTEGEGAFIPDISPPEGFTFDTEKFIPTKPVTAAEKVIEFPRKYSKDPFTKYIFQKSFDKTLEFFPRAKKALAEHKAEGLINKLRDTYDKANFQQRVTLNADVLKQIETLSKEEQAIIVPYLEGRASLINDSSEAFKKFETYYRDLSDTIQKDLAAMGKLEPEQIKARLYQPLEKATGKTTDEIIAELGDFTPAYVHHTFPEKFAKKMGDFFADTTGKRFKPSFLKRSQGVAGYTENLKEILPKWTAQYVKLKNTEAFLNDFTGKFGIPVNASAIKEVAGGYQVGGKVYRGYKIVAPDNFLSFYKGHIDFYKEVSKRLESMDMDEAMADALQGALAGAGKDFVGVSKNKRVFLVPDNIVKNLESYATPMFGSQKAHNFIKLYYEKPQQFWKDSVLAVSPRWVKNNVIGDIIFNTMEGVGPLSYSRSFMSKYHDIIPDELLRSSFANVMKYNPKLGLAAKSTVGQLAEAIGQSPLVRGVSKVKDVGYALNTMFEQPFVRALYVKLAREEAIRLLKVERIAVNNESIMAKLAEMKTNPKLAEPVVTRVEKNLPVFDLTGNIERKYLKKVMPFYNWYKFMVKYAATLPINHPFKTVGARGLGALSEGQREQAFIQMFPYMKREIEEGGIPDRFDNLWPVKSPDAEGKAMFFNSRGFNIFTTVEDMVKGNILNMMSPLIKMPIERATGREAFSGREYKTGEGGIGFKGKEKQLPALGDHILSQFPQYGLLKQTLVPARQYDTGTILNPDPILDKITGEYKYPIESVEKWLNLAGIDKRTLNVREAWDAYRKQKAIAIGETFTKNQSKADMALSLEDIKGIFAGIKNDPVKWKAIINEMKGNAQQTVKEKKELMGKIQPKN